MSALKNHRRDLIATSLMLVGPFAFIEALLFRPRMLTPYLSGMSDVVPVDLQTLATVFVLLLACVAARPLISRVRPWVVAASGILLPCLCIALIASIRAFWVPVVVACALAVSCGLMLRLVLAWRPFDPSSTLEDYGVSAMITLGVSSLLSHGSYLLAPNDAYGTMALALVVGASGLIAWAELRRAGGRLADAQSPSGQGSDEVAHRRQKALIEALIPLVPAGLICSLSLGMSSGDDSLEPMLRLAAPFAAGTVIALLALLVMVLRWRRHSEERGGDIVLFLAVPCALAVSAAIVANAIDFTVVFAILVCSNLTFLALIWIDMLYLTGRKLFATSSAPVVALVIVLLVFCFGMLLAAVLPGSITTVAAPLAAVAYLVYLVFYFQRQADGYAFPLSTVLGLQESGVSEVEAGPRLSYDEIRLAACRAMADEFGLSPKEAEVLPLLVTGISAAAIGRQLYVSHETVKTHKYHIYQKLGTHNYEETVEIFERFANEAARA